jgi:hypothetical protein
MPETFLTSLPLVRRGWFANHALQRTRPSRRGCNRCVPCAGSLNLARLQRLMNTVIEIHDSKVSEITNRGGTVIVHFEPAYLHKSEGRPGFDPGTGWVQEACLIFADAATSGDFPELPCDMMDGDLIVGGERHSNLIPVPFETSMLAELRLVFDSIHTVTISGRGARLELVGEPRDVEEFRPH